MRTIGKSKSFSLALVMVTCGVVFLFAARYYPFAFALCAMAFVAAAAFGAVTLKGRG